MEIHEFVKTYISSALAAAALCWTVATGRGKAAQEAQDKLETRIATVEKSGEAVRERLLAVEMTVRHLPTRDQFDAIAIASERLSGKMEALSGSMVRVEKLLEKRSDDGARA